MKAKLILSIILSIGLAGCASTTSYKGSKYQFVYKEVTWFEAKSLAEEAGGKLACFETMDELSYVQSAQGNNNTAWVGVTDEKDEGNWEWINGVILSPSMIGYLQTGNDLESRDYGHILIQGGLMSRHSSGILPRNWVGQKQVKGYIVEWD